MIEYITPERIANAIMQDKTYNGYYLLVEGIKDSKLFGKFVSKNNIRIKESFGCNNLLKTFEILCQRGFENKIGIIDRDFHEVLKSHPQIENIFMTDYHDIEVMIFCTKAFENVLNIFTVPEKITNFEATKGLSIKNVILELSTKIGYLKLANKKNNLGLVFKPKQPEGNPIKYRDFISDDMTFLGNDKMIKSIINYSRNKSSILSDYETIHRHYTELMQVKYDQLQMSNGHDISNLIFILLKKHLKSTNSMLNDANCVEDSLILAYDFELFKATRLYKELDQFSRRKNIELFSSN